MIDAQINKKYYRGMANFFVRMHKNNRGSHFDRHDVIQHSQNKFSDVKPENMRDPVGDVVEKGLTL